MSACSASAAANNGLFALRSDAGLVHYPARIDIRRGFIDC
jgi:hypothetical protein